ncbi:MAG: prokaryotic diacylglycerol kinase [Bacilli bacterium]|nr:prokaryotic diacylglycerol kinase [Bacilli bacterium]
MKAALRWLRSFRFAYEGLQYALATQRNMKFHFFISFVALTSALLFRISKVEILFIILAITLVIMTELINTAVEKTVDLAMPEQHPLAKVAKDLAAASVLVAAVFAVIVGTIVFYTPISHWFHHEKSIKATITSDSVWLYLALVIVTVIVMETRFSHSRRLRPSLWMAIAFSLSTLITLLTTNTLVSILAYSLSILFMIMLYEKKNRPLSVSIFGAFIGCAITILAFYLNH